MDETIRNELRQTESTLSVNDQISIDTLELRKDIAKKIVKLFSVANLAIFLVVFVTIGCDQWNVTLPGYSRMFTEQVFMAIVGGTVVQLGAISFALSRWLFPTGS